MLFSQLPSKVQELLIKQLQQTGQGLQQLQQSKFLLLNAQQASIGSSGSSSSGKLDQKGDVQTTSSGKQVTKKVTQITVKQLTGAVQESSQSKKQVTKNAVQVVAKQTPDQSSQQKQQASHKQPSSNKPQHQPQGTANAKGTEANKQRATKDGKKRRPPKNTSKDIVDKEEETMNEEEKEAEAEVIMKSPTKEETETVKAITSAVKKEVDIMLCFVCLEER